MSRFYSFIRDESGATAIEYGLIAALIAVGLIAVLQTLGSDLRAKYTDIASAISGAKVN